MGITITKNFYLLLIFVAFSASTFAQQQVLTKYGDNVATLDGIIKAYYDVVTVKKGEKVCYERDSLLHVPNVRVAAIGQDQKGKNFMQYTSLKQFHKQSDAYMERDGFIETEVDRKVEHLNNLWHVWSSYESRNTAAGPVVERGTNSIELYYDGKRYWILGWFYD